MLKTIVIRILFVFLLLSVFRIIFYFIYIEHFGPIDALLMTKIGIQGWRFDFVTIAYANGIWILLEILFPKKRWIELIVRGLYILPNCLIFLAEMIDWNYYRFSMRRLSIDILSMKQDILNQKFLFIIQYWYVVLIALILVFIFDFIYKKTKNEAQISTEKKILYALISIPILLVAARGGFQLRPLSPVYAAKYTPQEYAPIITNSVFNFIFSLTHQALQEVSFFSSKAELKKYFSTTHQYTNKNPAWQNKNIVLIIVESLSSEYLNHYNPQIHRTPFLDSIIGKSTICNQNYANGKQSMKGNIAILSSLPTLMEEPIITGAYQGNSLPGIPAYLETLGYSSAYLHGAKNGSMNLDSYTKKIGFQKYYGLNEYPNPQDYDGQWGIWDDKFLRFTAEKINNLPEPFLATVFTLSNHHPFHIPDAYKNIYKDEDPKMNTIAYTDASLKIFFENVKNSKWYSNTIFLITGDHTGLPLEDWSNGAIGRYQVPLIIYNPMDTVMREINHLTQHADILPTLLDQVGYQEKFHAYGTSIYDTSAVRFATQYTPPLQMITSNTCVQLAASGEMKYHCFEKKENVDCEDSLQLQRFAVYLKAIMQTYNDEIIHDKLNRVE